MHRRSNHISTLIILLSILTVTVQFSIYYFLGASLITFGLAALLVLLCSHIFLERTRSYEPCFSYSLLNIFISFIIILLSYYAGTESFLIYQQSLILFIVINWAVPTLYYMIRCLFDHSSKYANFNLFYRNISIVFLIIYIRVFVHFLFLNNEVNIVYFTEFRSINLVPFLTLATLIEDYMGGYVSVSTIIIYLVQGILLFVPYGFLTLLFMKHTRILTRVIVLLCLPILVEVVQRIFLLGKGDIDDIILGMIGGTIGALGYHLLNVIFRSVTDEDFLYARSRYSFYNNSRY